LCSKTLIQPRGLWSIRGSPRGIITVQEHEVHEVNWVTKATRNFVSKEESLEILVGFDTQIGVFVAGLAQIEKK
jgi:hypothetical protein